MLLSISEYRNYPPPSPHRPGSFCCRVHHCQGRRGCSIQQLHGGGNYNTVTQDGTTQYKTAQHSIRRQHSTGRYTTVQDGTTQYKTTTQHRAEQNSAGRYTTAQDGTAQHRTVQHCIRRYNQMVQHYRTVQHTTRRYYTV